MKEDSKNLLEETSWFGYNPHEWEGGQSFQPLLVVPSSQGHKAVDLLPNYQVRRRLVQKQMVKRYVDGKGKPRVCGGMDLKRSQAYPKQCLGQAQQFLFVSFNL